jgi:hypothetical protein
VSYSAVSRDAALPALPAAGRWRRSHPSRASVRTLRRPRVRSTLRHAGTESRLFFWRTNHGAEVDLLVERHGKLRLAVEIKAKSRIGGADLTGLRAFADQHPTVPRMVASLAPQPFELEGIRIVGYADFFDHLQKSSGKSGSTNSTGAPRQRCPWRDDPIARLNGRDWTTGNRRLTTGDRR